METRSVCVVATALLEVATANFTLIETSNESLKNPFTVTVRVGVVGEYGADYPTPYKNSDRVMVWRDCFGCLRNRIDETTPYQYKM
jgi:hypothetical protein